MEFSYFQQLPPELQLDILSLDNSTLIQCQIVSTSINFLTKDKFLSQVCSYPIKSNEIDNYINTHPENFMIISQYSNSMQLTHYTFSHELDSKVFYNDDQSDLVIWRDNNPNPCYCPGASGPSGPTRPRYQNSTNMKDELDLLSQYHIYTKRHRGHRFSKDRTLQMLKNKLDKFNIENNKELV